MRPGRAVRSLGAVLAAALGLAACSSAGAGGGSGGGGSPGSGPASFAAVAWSAPGPSTVPAFYDPPAGLAPAAHGTLIRYQRETGVPDVPAGAKLWRILYHSRSVTGADVAVSGYVVVPARAAPAGGFPVIDWAHGTTGVARTCAPSLFSEAPDSSGLYVVPDLPNYVSAGYAVAATDYEGLGGPGVHPYLVGNAEGQDVLDAALAAAQIPGLHLSRTTVIVGHSQGGQAALFAGQLAPSYAPSLHVVGTVAIAPLTEVASALPLAAVFKEVSLVASAAYAWSHTYPDLPMASLFRPAIVARVDQLMSSECLTAAGTALSRLPYTAVMQPNIGKDPALLRHLEENSPGAVHTDSPVLVLQGLADTTIPAFLAQTFEQKQCPQVHDDLALRLYPGASHGGVLISSEEDMLAWIAARLAGKSVAPGCSVVTVG